MESIGIINSADQANASIFGNIFKWKQNELKHWQLKKHDEATFD